MNSITLTGNLTDTPTKHEAANGRLFASFSMANSEYVNGENRLNGFFDVTVFGPQAEHVLASLKKGSRVIVTGRLNQNTFEREDGSQGSRVRVTAQAVAVSLEFSPSTGTDREETADRASADEPALVGA